MLLVPACFRSSCHNVPRCLTNFGSGARAATLPMQAAGREVVAWRMLLPASRYLLLPVACACHALDAAGWPTVMNVTCDSRFGQKVIRYWPGFRKMACGRGGPTTSRGERSVSRTDAGESKTTALRRKA